jgi:hypothetical protein
VTALKRVDLPTFGRPTIPAWSLRAARIAARRGFANEIQAREFIYFSFTLPERMEDVEALVAGGSASCGRRK